MEVIDFLDHGAERSPDGDCFAMGAQRWSYAEARDRTLAVAAALLRDDFARGAKAAVISPNHPEAYLCILGLLRARMVWLPVNPRYTLDDMISLLDRFECEVIFLHSSFASAIPVLREALPRVRLIVSIDEEAEGSVFLPDWQGDPADWRDTGPWSPEDVAAIVATGGTTGKPKGIMQSHRGLATYVANHLATMPADTPPRYLVAAPMTHAAGLMCLPMLVRGGTIFVIDGAQARAVADAIRQWEISDIFLPPTAIYNMLADPDIAAMTFPSLRYLLYGAAPMSVTKLREALKLFGPVMVHGFGQMEAIMLCTVLAPADHYRQHEIADDERLSSCGRPAPLVNLAIMAEGGELLAAGEVGEIVVRGGNVMLGYFGDPEATADASRFGWHHTGDLGYRDGEGFYHIVDRAKDLIISGGFNIYPSEIEQHIWAHPAVRDCAVVGAPDEKWGEAVTAIVELKPGASVSADELIALCKARLGSIKAPKRVEFWPELPRSAVGKVLKREIRDRFWEGRQSRI